MLILAENHMGVISARSLLSLNLFFCAIMESMKKLLKNKVALLLVGALVVGFGASIAYLSMTDSQKNPEQKKEEVKSNDSEETQTEKGGGIPTEQPSEKTQTPAQEKAPTENSTSLSTLGASVTAQKNPSDNSVDILFYLEGSGSFTIQEKSGSAWVTLKENQAYSGRGGLSAGSIPDGQASKTVRALKIENGKYTAVTKEFTILRAEVEAALGIKTYN